MLRSYKKVIKSKMIELIKVGKKFKKRAIIKDVSYNFNTGDCILIEGENGCGKSTLLKIISGLMFPTSGEVKMDSTNTIGALIENPSFLENESLIENLKFLYNLKNKFNEERVKKLCDLFKLDLYNHDRMKNYSVGMRQKAGIIQAIMEDQNIILLDEPTRGLDGDASVIFMDYINALINEKSKTIIICAHSGVEKINFNKFLLLKDGVICEKKI